MKSTSKTTVKAAVDIGIPIGIAAFRASTQDYLDRIRHSAHRKHDVVKQDDFDQDDYIAMLRLWNTIDLSDLAKTDEVYRDYASAFFPGMVERATHALNAVPTKGMALYSKQHDVYIGGKPHGNSQYRLIADP
jgi:hypothetical protein